MQFREALSARLRPFVPRPARDAIKSIRSVVRGMRRSSSRALGASDLARDLRAAGIKNGDVLFVHTSLAKIGNVDGGAATVIAALTQAVGKNGTLAMPAYGTAEAALRAHRDGNPVDLRTEPSQTGKITEAFRRTAGVVRSSHPFSSVCAWGAQAEFLTSGHANEERICHSDSPIARFLQLGGKVVGLGVSLGPVSFYHVIEDTWDGFPFNTYVEPVDISYVDASGRQVNRRITYYDRELTARRIDSDGGIGVRAQMTSHLSERGLLHSFTCGAASSWWFDAEEVYAELQLLAARGITIYADTARTRV
ncbi:MAG TPA: AAC(3) family N-acetyltransferase [Candidatus Acidoferrales bacterium]|nr:AAC(3) family N-acetyltransferase [Candidatus Acidoferrales bacterium]